MKSRLLRMLSQLRSWADARSAHDRPAGLGTWSVAVLAFTILGVVGVLAFAVTKPDIVQGEYVRLLYIHPAVAWVSYLAFGVCAAASLLYLIPQTRSRYFDYVAGAAAEAGAVFCALTLITGSIWGRPTWGVWWTWDARLTSSAVMFAVQLGYLALRRAPGNRDVRARRCAITGLIAVINVPIVHFSVEWWRTLHQGRTLLRPTPTIDGTQLTAMLLSIVGYTLLFAWLATKRFRVERLHNLANEQRLNVQLTARRQKAQLGSAQPSASPESVR
jgi:heme exporter protein C